MRLTLLSVALVLSVSGPAGAQDWEEFVSVREGFTVNFPGRPTVTETTWTSQLGYTLPARVYSADKGREHYTLTFVDYSDLERQGIERSKTCPPGNAQCRANAGPVIGPGYWKQDERGAVVYATFRLLQRNATLTSLAWEWQDLVEGHSIQLTNNADGSRTSAFIAMHEHRLYILEGTVPKGFPEPGLFQQSLGWIDKDGKSIRYQGIYSNSFHGLGVYPPPPIVGDGATGSTPPAAAPSGGR